MYKADSDETVATNRMFPFDKTPDSSKVRPTDLQDWFMQQQSNM